ncbi:MAG: flagellar M-ring protein FliF [Verrucomicrobia bacterium GWF2_51_19]|nr:MAG: flagellar M-ring protein FliF [Verrucomicrobia bacterium GWF2_51_19]HCJ12453.1 flagellar M-ring protein FliF [Opitutae bacterium]
MNFLEQIKQLWKDLGFNQKISIFVSFVFVATCMIALLMWAGKPQMQLLYGGIESKDMSQIVTMLESQSIPYKVGPGGSSILVPQDKVYSLRMDLAAKGIPNGGGVGFEVFDKSNFGISDFVQRTNYIRAIQGELSRTIAQLNSVREARVMIVMPENRLLSEQSKIKATASVFVDTGGMTLREDEINAIRFLVANAVEGLSANDVAVVDNKGNVLSQEMQSDGTFGAATSQLRYRRNLEEYFAKKIESMLSRIVGPGNAVARVSVEVETDTSTMVAETFDPESQVVRSQTVTETSTSTTASQAGQAPGVQANTPAETTSTGTGNNNASKESQKNKTIAYDINKTRSERIQAPGAIKRMSASVFIDKAAEVAGSEEQLKKVKVMVANALGLPSDSKDVTIEAVAFHKMEEKPDSMMNLPVPLVRWMELARNFIAVGIAIVMFAVFLRLLKKSKPESFSLEMVDNGPKMLLSQENATRTTPDLLNELIRQKPENVSTALKDWVNTNQQ